MKKKENPKGKLHQVHDLVLPFHTPAFTASKIPADTSVQCLCLSFVLHSQNTCPNERRALPLPR